MYIFDTQVIVYIMLVRLMSGSPVCIIWLCMIMILYNVCIIIYYYMFTKYMKKKEEEEEEKDILSIYIIIFTCMYIKFCTPRERVCILYTIKMGKQIIIKISIYYFCTGYIFHSSSSLFPSCLFLFLPSGLIFNMMEAMVRGPG